jgi:5-methylcytosine-specific restriction endonuclease McrA
MRPFNEYPGKGRKLLGRVSGGNCHHEYGLKFMRRTGQRKCAYCGVDFTSSYEVWLTMALDHVVPVSVCASLGIPVDWREDISNRVLSCAACNGFRNRYTVPEAVPKPRTLDEFYDLRDRIFAERKKLITESHRAERRFFESKPWETEK